MQGGILMDHIATWSESDRADLMREAGVIKKLPPEVIEKDFWVCWVLDRLFGSPDVEQKILFKGGTSLSKVFNRPACKVKAIKAERTFWEKITILHHEAHRPKSNTQPARYSRHYYDLYRMAQTQVKKDAFADLDLLQAVVAFKDKFYHRGWARYDMAVPGTMKLVPPEHVMKAVERDYAEMQFMIFGDRPSFQDMIQDIQLLEDEINTLSTPIKE